MDVLYPELNLYWYCRRTFSETLRKTTKPVKKLNNKKPVLVVRRIIDYKGQLEGTEVDIKSAALCEALMDINRGVEGLRLTRNPPVVSRYGCKIA